MTNNFFKNCSSALNLKSSLLKYNSLKQYFNSNLNLGVTSSLKNVLTELVYLQLAL